MKPTIIDITGIGPAAAATLDEHDIKSVADLANSSIERITTVPGFSDVRAPQVIAAAAELLTVSGITQAAEGEGTESGKKDKASGKGKKDKKGKKGKKGKKDKKSKGKGKSKGKEKGKK